MIDNKEFIFSQGKQNSWEQSEKKFQNIVNACPMGMHLYELQEDGNLIFTGSNPAADKILGLDHSIFVGKTIENAFPLLSSTNIPFKCKEVAAQGVMYKTELDYNDEKVKGIFEILAFQVEPGKMATFFQDITERKRMEFALKESEEKLRFLSENLAEGMVYQIDSGIDGKARNFTYLSHAVERLHGVTVEEVLENPFRLYEQVVPEDVERVQKGEDAAFKNKTTFEIDIMVKLPCGETRWRRFISTPRVKPNGSTIWDGIELDITKAKKAEMMLAEEKERLKVTLKSIGDGVISTDINGCVTMMNSVAEKLTGWTIEEAQGKPLSFIFFIISEITGEPLQNPVEKVLASKKIIEMENNTILLSKDGSPHIIADSAAPILDTKGNILGVVLVFRDITEKQKLLKEAQKIQKLEYLGIIAGGIAHDFNNLLGGIFGCVDLALGITEESKSAEYLMAAMQSIQRARHLTQQLLTFSKGGSPVCQIAPLFPFIKDTVHFVLSGSSILTQFTAEENLLFCNYDKNQLAQVLENIVLNARQAMPEGGTIHISAQNIILQEKEHEPLPQGRYVKISISDTGKGIASDILPKIFDPFFTTKSYGNGLGLSICYSIINRHSGKIEVESALEKGTTFHIFLPAYNPVPVSAKPSTEKLKKYKGSGKILLMDDDAMIRKSLGGMLLRLGYEPVCVENGWETMQSFHKAAAEGNNFKAIILDLTVPGGMGGKEIATEIRKTDKEIAIFASSGYAQDPVIANPKDYGFTASICKPFKTSELADMLGKNIQPDSSQKKEF
ncbi:MAG: PAS domain S-box protein [Candidatus Brocadiae bacterium]|nr:PAS domain S-box protein [Candidatus Brocadiia bacterium]